MCCHHPAQNDFCMSGLDITVLGKDFKIDGDTTCGAVENMLLRLVLLCNKQQGPKCTVQPLSSECVLQTQRRRTG